MKIISSVILLYCLLFSNNIYAQWEDLGTIDNGDINQVYNCNNFNIDVSKGEPLNFIQDNVYVKYNDSTDCKRISYIYFTQFWNTVSTKNYPTNYNQVITCFMNDTMYLAGTIADTIFIHKLINDTWINYDTLISSLLDFKSYNNTLYILRNDYSVLKYENNLWIKVVDAIGYSYSGTTVSILGNPNFTIDDNGFYIYGITNLNETGYTGYSNVMMFKSFSGNWSQVLDNSFLNPYSSYLLKINNDFYLLTKHLEQVNISTTRSRVSLFFLKEGGNWTNTYFYDVSTFGNPFNYKGNLGLAYVIDDGNSFTPKCQWFDGLHFNDISNSSFTGSYPNAITTISDSNYVYVFYADNTQMLSGDVVQYSVKRISNPSITTAINNSVNTETPKIYPNPIQDKIYINGFDNKEYLISNQYGIAVKSGIVKDETINTSDLTTGMYFLQINDSTIKIIKE